MYGSGKKKKKPIRNMKPCLNGECQHEVPKRVEESKKIKPKEVFGSNYTSTNSPKKTKASKKVPKGSHRMPDGSIMKDKDMKKKKK